MISFKKYKKPLLAIFTLVIIAGLVAGIYQRKELSYQLSAPETYEAAGKRCGHNPVIGSHDSEAQGGDIYYEPASEGNSIKSEYDPAAVDISQYNRPQFFCSVEEAKKAGYNKHLCCGFSPFRRDS